MSPRELDVVRFRVPIEEWPAGTTGTVLFAYGNGGVVEVGGTGDEVSVSYDDVEVIWTLEEKGSERIMFERFTERARQVIVLAQEEARTLKHGYIGTEHLLLGLLREEEGIAARALNKLDVSTDVMRVRLIRLIGTGDEMVTGQIPFTPRTKKVIEIALREALAWATITSGPSTSCWRLCVSWRGRGADAAGCRVGRGKDPQRGVATGESAGSCGATAEGGRAGDDHVDAGDGAVAVGRDGALSPQRS
jgi:hypothetical protein